MDKAFADVAAEYDRWARTDVTEAELIDALVEGSRYMAEQHDELQHTADLRLEALHREAQRYALAQQRYRAALRRCEELAHDLHTYRVIAFLAVVGACATWLRFGGVH